MDKKVILEELAKGKSIDDITQNQIEKIKIQKFLLELASQYISQTTLYCENDIQILGKPCSDGKIIIHTDGACSGNPGPCGMGCAFYNSKNELIATGSKYLGIGTNNFAEYSALIFALNILDSFENVKQLDIYADSELMVKQINGEYNVSSPSIKSLYDNVLVKIKQYPQFKLTHVLREKNKHADLLATQAIKKYNKK